jgi:hypothetical protein
MVDKKQRSTYKRSRSEQRCSSDQLHRWFFAASGERISWLDSRSYLSWDTAPMSRIKPGDLVQLNENSPYAAIYLRNERYVARNTDQSRVCKADVSIVLAIVGSDLFVMCHDRIGWTSLTTYFNVVS